MSAPLPLNVVEGGPLLEKFHKSGAPSRHIETTFKPRYSATPT